jgi:hypothetical protein
LLEKASKHPKLEIQLEAAFAQILLGQKKARDKLKLLAQNPIISNHAFAYLRELIHYKIDCGHTVEGIEESIEGDKDDFRAMAQMSEWCTHSNEYGVTPDAIKVWAKEEIYWPVAKKKLQVYLIRYNYNDYEWQGEIKNIEHVGYYVPMIDRVFSKMKDFDNILEAYAECADFDSSIGIDEEALPSGLRGLMKQYLPKI